MKDMASLSELISPTQMKHRSHCGIGIADFDPTRGLKKLPTSIREPRFLGLPAEMLQLPTAGSKFLRCTLKSKTIGGVSLGIY